MTACIKALLTSWQCSHLDEEAAFDVASAKKQPNQSHALCTLQKQASIRSETGGKSPELTGSPVLASSRRKRLQAGTAPNTTILVSKDYTTQLDLLFAAVHRHNEAHMLQR